MSFEFSDWRRQIGKFPRRESTDWSEFLEGEKWSARSTEVLEFGDGRWWETGGHCIGCTSAVGQITVHVRAIRREFGEFCQSRIEFVVGERVDAVSCTYHFVSIVSQLIDSFVISDEVWKFWPNRMPSRVYVWRIWVNSNQHRSLNKPNVNRKW